ncbi:MAG: hypothetical protein QNJ20_19590 [Paracoccaceae bacterium]|nr:hypothetical protein [Paracoccaceae bacterium]
MSGTNHNIRFAVQGDEQDFRDFYTANGLGRGAYEQSADFFIGYLKTKPDEDGWKLLLARNMGRIEGFATVSTLNGKLLLGQHLWAASDLCGNALYDRIERDGPLAKWI